MTLTNKINRVIEPIFVIALSLISYKLAKTSLVFVGLIPILFALFYFNEGVLSFLVAAVGTYLIGLFFIDKDDLLLSLMPLIFISISFIIPIGIKAGDKSQILTGFFVASLVFIFLYKYQMIVDKISIEDLAINLKSNFEKAYPYEIDFEIYKMTTAAYPALISSLSLVYSILAVKLIRNYLAFRTETYTDIKNLDDFRINLKELTFIFIVEIVIYCLLNKLGVNKTYILINLIFMNFAFFVINGASLFDYVLRNSKLPLSRAFQWFFLLILFEVLVLPLALFGLLDIFIDFRRRRRNEK